MLGQKSFENFVCFLGNLKTLKFPSEIIWPLARYFPKTPGLFCFHLRRWQERSFVCTLRLRFPAPLPSNLYTGCPICSSGYERIWNSKIMSKDHKKIFNLASKMQMQKSWHNGRWRYTLFSFGACCINLDIFDFWKICGLLFSGMFLLLGRDKLHMKRGD